MDGKDELIRRQDAIDALSEMQGTVAEKGVRKGISMAWEQIKDLPSAHPEQCTDILKAEIKRMKRSFTICINSDYYTGYMSALSALEGYIAKMEGDAE